MSVQVESYLIYGVKFGEEFTTKYFNSEIQEENEWFTSEDESKPMFLSDGMNGNYTFFGFIKQLSNGWNEDEIEDVEIDLSIIHTKEEIISYFSEFFPEEDINKKNIGLFYLKHWV